MSKRSLILAVDDEQGALRSLEMILKDDYDVIMAESGKQAVALLEEQPVDYIITDIHMADMTGIEVLHYSKEQDATREVLVVTGFANLETAKAALRLGAQDYIHKPFEAADILSNVENGLKKREKAHQALEQLHHLNKEKENLEDLLVQSEKSASLGELTCGVVHEINNPLTVIQGYVDLMMKKINANEAEHLKEDKYQDYLKTVEDQIHQCRNIAMDFLNFARGDSNEEKSLDVKLMLEDLVALYHDNPIGREVKFEIKTEESIPEIKLSIGLIRQVFVNMIVNALHAMDSKGTLEIVLRRKETGLEIDFKDTGKGIPDELKEKIFETFFTTKEGGKGSGLGLSISKKIVERHGGNIALQSKVGKGTTFTIFLPYQSQLQTKQEIA